MNNNPINNIPEEDIFFLMLNKFSEVDEPEESQVCEQPCEDFLNQVVKDLSKHIDTQIPFLKNLEKENEILKNDQEDLINELEVQKIKNGDLQHTIKAQEKAIRKHSDMIGSYHIKNEVLETQNIGLEKQRKENIKTIENLKKQNAEISNMLIEKNITLDQIDREQIKLTSEAEIIQAHQERIKELEEFLDISYDENYKLKEQITEIEDLFDELFEFSNRIESLLNDLRKENDHLCFVTEWECSDCSSIEVCNRINLYRSKTKDICNLLCSLVSVDKLCDDEYYEKIEKAKKENYKFKNALKVYEVDELLASLLLKDLKNNETDKLCDKGIPSIQELQEILEKVFDEEDFSENKRKEILTSDEIDELLSALFEDNKEEIPSLQELANQANNNLVDNRCDRCDYPGDCLRGICSFTPQKVEINCDSCGNEQAYLCADWKTWTRNCKKNNFSQWKPIQPRRCETCGQGANCETDLVDKSVGCENWIAKTTIKLTKKKGK